MDYLDISMNLNEKTVVWKDDEPPKLTAICRLPKEPCNFTWLNFSAHAGTHIDAPYYLFPESWTADEIPLDRLIGRCQVVDLTKVEGTISTSALRERNISRSKVLLKTKNSLDPLEHYNPRHVDMNAAAAQYLIENGLTTLGYDYQSFERAGANDLHRIFLGKNITLIDNLRLGHVQAGFYKLVCLPVKVTGIDAAPARAILLEDKKCLAA